MRRAGVDIQTLPDPAQATDLLRPIDHEVDTFVLDLHLPHVTDMSATMPSAPFLAKPYAAQEPMSGLKALASQQP